MSAPKLVPRPALPARLNLHLSAAQKLVVFWLAFIASFGATPAQNSDELRYLLVRRAGTPEKNSIKSNTFAFANY